MKKIASLLLLAGVFVNCQDNHILDYNDIRIESDFYYNSETSTLKKRPLNDSFKTILGKTALYSNKGEYWDGLNFDLYPICGIEGEKTKTFLILKQIQLVDGKLAELYLVKTAADDNLLEVRKIAKQESTANCESEFSVNTKNKIGEIEQYQTCESGSQNEDENDDTSKTDTTKTLIDFSK